MKWMVSIVSEPKYKVDMIVRVVGRGYGTVKFVYSGGILDTYTYDVELLDGFGAMNVYEEDMTLPSDTEIVEYVIEILKLIEKDDEGYILDSRESMHKYLDYTRKRRTAFQLFKLIYPESEEAVDFDNELDAAFWLKKLDAIYA